MMAFPVSLPDDGLIDVMTMSRVRNESLGPRYSKLTVSRLQGVTFSRRWMALLKDKPFGIPR